MTFDALHKRVPALLAVLSVGILVAACGGPTPVPTRTPAAASPAVTQAPTQVPTQAPSGSTTFTVATAPIICCDQGLALVGPDGMTLYTFDRDATPNKSACESAECAGTWPALTATGTPTAASGISGTLATFERADNSLQVSYNGKPLYSFAGDIRAGDTTGDGISEVWHIAKP